MSTASAPAEQRLLIRNVDWRQYEALLEWAGERRLCIAYDRGELELMSPSIDHEDFKCSISRLITALAEELDLTIHEYGSVTWRREDIDRGAEPDTCFYLRSEPLIRGKSDIDLAVDPAPDLVLEIDITSSSVDREGIYAALGVSELWRYDGERLQVLILGADGKFEPSSSSLSFPSLPLDAFARFIDQGRGADQTAWIKGFRTWVRERLLPLDRREVGADPLP